MNRTLIAVLACLLFSSFNVFAQYSIRGTILSSKDKSPVPQASVFLNNGSNGALSDDSGHFVLRNIQPGNYNLIVSVVGYSLYSIPVTVENHDLKLSDILVSQQATALREVTVRSDNEATRQKYLATFEKAFLGTSKFADDCKIVNPEVLNIAFDSHTQTLTANSDDFLLIENHALGYRIRYLLSDFTLQEGDPATSHFFYTGSVHFEEMSGTEEDRKLWTARRAALYTNSLSHFLRAGVQGQAEKEGFSLFQLQVDASRAPDSLILLKIKQFASGKSDAHNNDSLIYWQKQERRPILADKQLPLPIKSEQLISKTKISGIYSLSGKTALYVSYNSSVPVTRSTVGHVFTTNDKSGTLIFFNQPNVYFDKNGSITNEGSVTFYGLWAKRGIAELLPIDFSPLNADIVKQDSITLDKLKRKLDKVDYTALAEKVYLHFDKPYYASGDTIYFRGYVTNALNYTNVASRVLNVELIGPHFEIQNRVQLKLLNGMASGDFVLPETLSGGQYHIRAYTNVMRNFDQNYFFRKTIFIGNASASNPVTTTNTDNRPIKEQTGVTEKADIQFFPEGGNLIIGEQSKIAFKAIADNGLGIDISGVVSDKNGNILTHFQSTHLGMGQFYLTPLTGETYFATVTFPGGAVKKYRLPEPNDKGYVLNIDNSDPKIIKLIIKKGASSPAQIVNIIAESGGSVYFYKTINISKGGYSEVVLKDDLPDGIMQFTLFSTAGEPMNDRAIFIKSGKQMIVSVDITREKTIPRGKMHVPITVRDENGRPLAGSFSMAVTDQRKVPYNDDDENGILSQMLLNSELGGYVEKPGYYFNHDDFKTANDLDQLLLTQGAHKFEWKKILEQPDKAIEFAPERSLMVTGKILTPGGKPIANGAVSLTSLSHVSYFADTTADAQGRFDFLLLPNTDSVRYMIQATDKEKRKNSTIVLTNEPPRIEKSFFSPGFLPADSLSGFLQASANFHQQQIDRGFGKHGIALKEVEVKARKTKTIAANSANLNGAGNANEVITGKQLSPGCPRLTDCLQGKLHGIQFFSGTPFYGGLIGHMETAVFIDGVEITGQVITGYNTKTNTPIYSGGPTKADIINQLNVNDIESIEIITSASLSAIYGTRGGGGVILITTKRFSDYDIKGGASVPFANFMIPGYQKAKIFYSPKYDIKGINKPIKDQRTTIYWNPSVTTGQDGKGLVEFYNADDATSYRVILEGLDDKGHIGRLIYHYDIK